MPKSDIQIAEQWTDEAQQLQFKQIDTVRSFAQRWLGLISTFLGATGLAGISFVPATIDKVTGWAYYPVLTLSGLTVVLAICALFLGARASGLSPLRVWSTGPDYRTASEKYVNEAIPQLEQSQNFTYAALACLLLSAALATINPGAKPQPALALVIQKDGKGVLCGKVQMEAKTGVVSLVPGGASTPTPLTEVASVTKVDKCPPNQ